MMRSGLYDAYVARYNWPRDVQSNVTLHFELTAPLNSSAQCITFTSCAR